MSSKNNTPLSQLRERINKKKESNKVAIEAKVDVEDNQINNQTELEEEKRLKTLEVKQLRKLIGGDVKPMTAKEREAERQAKMEQHREKLNQLQNESEIAVLAMSSSSQYSHNWENNKTVMSKKLGDVVYKMFLALEPKTTRKEFDDLVKLAILNDSTTLGNPHELIVQVCKAWVLKQKGVSPFWTFSGGWKDDLDISGSTLEYK